MIFAVEGPKGDPIDTPSISSWKFLLKEKAVLLHASNNSFTSNLLLSVVEIFFSLYTVQDDFNSVL